MHEGDEPDFIAHLLYPHVLASEDGAEVDLAPAQADPATVGDGHGAVVKRVLEFAEAAIRPR